MVAVVSKGWPRFAQQHLPVDDHVLRNPDMRILVRSLLCALNALGCRMPVMAAGVSQPDVSR
jgi:hypothetical protein